MLCLLEGELDQAAFHTLMSQFVTYWSTKEHDFVKLFENVMLIVQVCNVLHISVTETCITLPAHRGMGQKLPPFEHGDTDTNMFLER